MKMSLGNLLVSTLALFAVLIVVHENWMDPAPEDLKDPEDILAGIDALFEAFISETGIDPDVFFAMGPECEKDPGSWNCSNAFLKAGQALAATDYRKREIHAYPPSSLYAE